MCVIVTVTIDRRTEKRSRKGKNLGLAWQGAGLYSSYVGGLVCNTGCTYVGFKGAFHHL